MTVRPRSPVLAALALAVAGIVAACAGSTADDTVASEPTATSASPAVTTTNTTTTNTTTTATTNTTTTSPPSTSETEPVDASTSTTSEVATSTTAGESPHCVEQLTVRERAALVVWPAVYADDWAGAIDVVRSNDVGGVLLMNQPGLDGDEVRTRLSELEAASRHGLIVATDEEGGDVQRLSGLGALASQRSVSRELTTDEAADVIAAHGATIRAAGVDMVFGPVIDVEPNTGTVPLQASRFFEGGPDLVAAYGAAYLAGWQRADLFATVKHYPGHGAASGDTHISDGVTPSLGDLREFDLKPYGALLDDVTTGDAAVMVGHLTVPGLTDGMPATRSAAAVDYLRNDLGYGDVLLVSDALGMAAVGIAEPEASVLALAAGIDVVLFTLTSQTGAVIDALEAAVGDGTIDADHLDGAAQKVMAMLGRDGHSCNGNRR